MKQGCFCEDHSGKSVVHFCFIEMIFIYLLDFKVFQRRSKLWQEDQATLL